MVLKNEDLLSIYRYMLMGRALEQAIVNVSGKWLDSMGEEGVIVGTYYNLKKEDIVAPHFRGSLVAYYMRGASLRKLFAGILGKATSYSKGRIISKCGPIEINAVGWLSPNVGPQINLGTGGALAAKIKKTDQVAVVAFGDGTSNRGEFHEAINMASVLKLPAVYVCQNNQWSISLPLHREMGCASVADRAAGYGIPGVEVDGNDVLAVHEVVQEAVKRAREGNGPSLIDAKTYRVRGHWASDPDLYRSKEEIEVWKKRDPIDLFKGKLLQSGVLTEKKEMEIRKSVEVEVASAMKQAEEDPLPDEKMFGEDEIFYPARKRG